MTPRSARMKHRADDRVARERELRRRREDPEPELGLQVGRGEHEGRLGEVHLLRDRLHLLRVEPFRLGEYRELDSP